MSKGQLVLIRDTIYRTHDVLQNDKEFEIITKCLVILFGTYIIDYKTTVEVEKINF